MKANKFIVSDLVDSSAIPAIKQSISSHDGINSVRVDMQASTVTVDYDEARYSEKHIQDFISQAGLNVDKIQ
jgi:copper chaperone CopZ